MQAVESYCAAVNAPLLRQAIPDLSASHFGDVIFLHIAALAAIEDRFRDSARGLLDYLIDRERGNWEKGLEDLNLRDAIDTDGLQQALVLITLIGGSMTQEGGWVLLKESPLLSDTNIYVRKKVASLLHQLYPGEHYLGPMRPDIAGEHLVALEIDRESSQDNDSFINRTLLNIKFEQRMHAIAIFARMTRQYPNASQWLQRAIEVSRVMENPAMILRSLEEQPSRWSLRDDDIDMLRPLLSAV